MMISSNIKMKSILLALAMIVATPSQGAEAPVAGAAVTDVVAAAITPIIEAVKHIPNHTVTIHITSGQGAQASAAAVATAGAPAVTNPVMNFILNNKLLVTGFTTAIVSMYIRLLTKPRPQEEYHLDQLRDDLEELLESGNIFNKKLYKKLVRFLDKWIIGLEIKIEETKTKTKNEDGSIFFINGKKLIQKPFGLLGLIDAYILKQVKKTIELVPGVVGFYWLLKDPIDSFRNAAGNKPATKPS